MAETAVDCRKNKTDCSPYIIGDGSVSTLWRNSNLNNHLNKLFNKRRKFQYINYSITLPDLLHNALPDSKIIAILRDPIKR